MCLGFGSIFKNIFRVLAPIAKKGLKTVGKEALRVGTSVAADALSGANAVQSLEERGKESAVRMLQNINEAVSTSEQSQPGPGRVSKPVDKTGREGSAAKGVQRRRRRVTSSKRLRGGRQRSKKKKKRTSAQPRTKADIFDSI
jgi:hypothetical protein